MRPLIRLFIGLVGAGAAIIAAKWYLSTAQGATITDPESFVTSLQAIAIASVIMAGGAWVSIKAALPKTSL